MVSLKVFFFSWVSLFSICRLFLWKSDAISDRGNLAFLFLNVGSTWAYFPLHLSAFGVYDRRRFHEALGDVTDAHRS